MTPQEVLAYCREKEVKAIDIRFTDFPGTWQHFTIPVSKLDTNIFEDGLGFDGSSIRGWQAINESDMLVVPQPHSAVLDPFTELPTLVMLATIQDPITGEDYSRDPRNVARKAANYLKSTGIADMRRTSDPRRSSLSSTIFALIRMPTKAITIWIVSKANGIAAIQSDRIWVTSYGTRKATFRCRPPIR